MDTAPFPLQTFKKMTVLLNVGGIVDMGFISEVKPDAVLYAWQGGMGVSFFPLGILRAEFIVE